MLHALVRKRAELAGQIAHKEFELQRTLGELTHVDSTIRLFTEDVDVGAIRP
ncbi:MAG: hypothetical protein JWP28_3820, partial [Phenylobacterium sp.]|nr:hypothetical protein [Phenylobacterium sp.]